MFWSSTQNLANTEFLITWFCYFFIIFKFFAYAHEIEEKKNTEWKSRWSLCVGISICLSFIEQIES